MTRADRLATLSSSMNTDGEVSLAGPATGTMSAPRPVPSASERFGAETANEAVPTTNGGSIW